MTQNEMEQNVTRGEFGQFQKAVGDSFVRLENSMEGLVKSVTAIADKVATQGRTDWRVIWGGIAVMLSVMGMMFSVSWLVVSNELTSLKNSDVNLDHRLQREMRDLNHSQDVAVNSVKDEFRIWQQLSITDINRKLDELAERRMKDP